MSDMLNRVIFDNHSESRDVFIEHTIHMSNIRQKGTKHGKAGWLVIYRVGDDMWSAFVDTHFNLRNVMCLG